MARKEDIGKLIKNRFEGVEKSPEDSLWEKIDGTLQKRKKKKRFFLILFFLVLFVAVNSFLFLDYFSLQTNSGENFNSPEVSNEKNPSETEINTNNSIESELVISEEKTYKEQNLTENGTSEPLKIENHLSQSNETGQTKKNASTSEKVTINSAQDQSVTNNQRENIQNTTTKMVPINDTALEMDITEVTPKQKLDSIQGEKNNNSKEEEEEPIKPTKNWSVMILGGLNTYNSFNKGSLIHPSLDDFKRSGTLDYTYGFALRFDLTKNLAISYGINKTTFSYFTQNIPSSSEAEINRILNYTDLSSGQTISSTELSNFLQNESQTDLLHQIEYIELPFLIRYNLSNKRFGIQTIGGISTYLINKENLYVQKENDDRLTIGSLNNLTGTRFSLNLGAGLYYEISENLLIELNPVFKYSLSKFSNRSSGDRPFSIGVFTGLTYKIF